VRSGARTAPARLRAAALLALALAGGCRTGQNYPGAGPRYAAPPPVAAARRAGGDTLRLVTFNIAYARRVDRATALLAAEPALRGADVVLLQEMDAPGTRRIAEALGLGYVYYPAIVHHRTERDFGNAVRSRWPIVEDARIVLPHRSRYAGTQRTATAATLQVSGERVRVYSAHLGTIADVGPGARREQLRAVLADAAPYARVVIGGDLNDAGVGRVAREAGYAWPTERGPRTMRLGRVDHLFLRGLASPDSAAAGTVVDTRGASDHRPVWAVGLLR
jgi:endonuclease/exonuclease/phosphatase family metal-dependent hydrolase